MHETAGNVYVTEAPSNSGRCAPVDTNLLSRDGPYGTSSPTQPSQRQQRSHLTATTMTAAQSPLFPARYADVPPTSTYNHSNSSNNSNSGLNPPHSLLREKARPRSLSATPSASRHTPSHRVPVDGHRYVGAAAAATVVAAEVNGRSGRQHHHHSAQHYQQTHAGQYQHATYTQQHSYMSGYAQPQHHHPQQRQHHRSERSQTGSHDRRISYAEQPAGMRIGQRRSSSGSVPSIRSHLINTSISPHTYSPVSPSPLSPTVTTQHDQRWRERRSSTRSALNGSGGRTGYEGMSSLPSSVGTVESDAPGYFSTPLAAVSEHSRVLPPSLSGRSTPSRSMEADQLMSDDDDFAGHSTRDHSRSSSTITAITSHESQTAASDGTQPSRHVDYPLSRERTYPRFTGTAPSECSGDAQVTRTPSLRAVTGRGIRSTSAAATITPPALPKHSGSGGLDHSISISRRAATIAVDTIPVTVSSGMAANGTTPIANTPAGSGGAPSSSQTSSGSHTSRRASWRNGPAGPVLSRKSSEARDHASFFDPSTAMQIAMNGPTREGSISGELVGANSVVGAGPASATSGATCEASTAGPLNSYNGHYSGATGTNGTTSMAESHSAEAGESFQHIPQAPVPALFWNKASTFGKTPPKALRAHTVTVVGERLFVFGGCDARTCFRDLYIFDADTMYWSSPETRGDLPRPCRAHSATLVGRKLYIFGGGDGPNYFNDLYLLDTDTLTWQMVRQSGDIPGPRRAHTTCYFDGFLYLFGGGDGVRALNDVYRLNTRDGNEMRWQRLEPKGEPPIPRGYHSATLAGSKLVVFGGSDGHACFSDAHLLDLVTCTWHQLSLSEVVPRLSHTATLVGSYMFVFGGHDGLKYNNEMLPLNLTTMNWERRPIYGRQPSSRGYHACVLYDSRLFVFGGYDGQTVFDEVWILELSANAYLPQIKNFEITRFSSCEEEDGDHVSLSGGGSMTGVGSDGHT